MQIEGKTRASATRKSIDRGARRRVECMELRWVESSVETVKESLRISAPRDDRKAQGAVGAFSG
jgi:hypothetical protein